MNLEFLLSMGKIRRVSPDKGRAQSLVNSSEANMDAITAIPLNEKTSTIIFRETYESIRQLGDARWWSLGYAPKDHEASIEILKEEKIPRSSLLPKLDRFRQIRHNANYGGYRVSVAVTNEIVDFWNLCGKEILSKLKNDLK
ncbi:MAG: hypothetical protein AB1324_01575 [Candidatus Micrarchaeota archaeon]